MPEQENSLPRDLDLRSPQVRNGKNGAYVKIHAHEFEQGVKVALENACPEIQLTGPVGNDKSIPDFKLLEGLAGQLTSMIFYNFNVVKEIRSFESIYSLQKIVNLSFQEKQNFPLELTRFPHLTKLGAEYWKGMSSIFEIAAMESLVISNFPGKDLVAFASLKKLKTLHIYRSKIETLTGIEALSSLAELNLSRNTSLRTIEGIAGAERLTRLHVEKCPKLQGLEALQLPSTVVKASIDGKAFRP